jgi:hypothetical protein
VRFFTARCRDFGLADRRINALTIGGNLIKIGGNAAERVALMADTIVCPHCKGTGVNYVIVTKDGVPSIQAVPCAVCAGKGNIPAPAPKPAAPPPPPEPELWPILVPLGIFLLFFFFLWL